MKKCLLILSLISISGLVGCTREPATKAPPNVLTTAGGYYCTVINKKNPKQHKFLAWSTNRRNAIAYAMSRCQSRGGHPNSCKLQGCLWTGSRDVVAPNRWYSCYAMNRKQLGTWSSTSHDRLTAMKKSFERCRTFSNNPKWCYLSYCRIW